ncbi:uncharacterized protein LOC134330542 [Trichomycterus rosablanca]|uniref:uncharacterized protein LOC134330542 n=1 Tax=Trichomycterus rosablanca TaxID=2290929 RepID=UPI002F354D42
MATDFTQDSVLRFILQNEGNVRNSELLAYFTEFLREHEDRARNRELFKRYVNAVATVKQEDGVSYVVLRKKYKPHLGDISSSTADLKSRADKRQDGAGQSKVGEFAPKSTQDEFYSLKAQVPNTEHILHSVGIVNNNYINIANLDQHVKTFVTNPWEERVSSIPRNEGFDNTCHLHGAPLNTKLLSGRGPSFERPLKAPDPKHTTVHNAKCRQLQETDDCTQKSFCPSDYPNYVVSATPPPKDVAHECTDAFQSFDHASSDAWPFPVSLGQSQNSASTPCLTDIPTAPSISYKRVSLSRSNDSLLKPDLYIHEPEDYEKTAAAPVSSAFQKGGTPTETSNPPLASGYLELSHHKHLSSSQNSLSQASSINSDGAGALSQEYWSSENALNHQGGEQNQPGTGHFHEVGFPSLLHSAELQGATWHHSTGHLLDKEPVPGSAPDNRHLKPVGRRLSHHLRSRMCRSLGADLDQAFREDADAARLKRLQRIKSFLNVASVSSSRAHSPMGSLSPAGSLHSLGHDTSYAHRHIQVPLEPQEHEWFVKAATGTWSDIYSLFREDPSLLAKRDFVSGYTILHWIAKHGDHRVLNTLWYGVTKAGTTLDVNTRSTCGYTPLHLAAIHGHKNLMRLLVHKYKANVALRDNNGKRPWQYLAKNDDQDLLDLLGAPKGKLGGNVGLEWHIDKPPVVPIIKSSGATVKRHSSLAALFKHKSNLRVSATPESFI